MNWSEKANEIANKVCTVDALKKIEIDENIIYNDDGRLDFRLICTTLRPLFEQAAVEGMKFELDNWMNRPKQNNDIQDEA